MFLQWFLKNDQYRLESKNSVVRIPLTKTQEKQGKPCMDKRYI